MISPSTVIASTPFWFKMCNLSKLSHIIVDIIFYDADYAFPIYVSFVIVSFREELKKKNSASINVNCEFSDIEEN